MQWGAYTPGFGCKVVFNKNHLKVLYQKGEKNRMHRKPISFCFLIALPYCAQIPKVEKNRMHRKPISFCLLISLPYRAQIPFKKKKPWHIILSMKHILLKSWLLFIVEWSRMGLIEPGLVMSPNLPSLVAFPIHYYFRRLHLAPEAKFLIPIEVQHQIQV